MTGTPRSHRRKDSQKHRRSKPVTQSRDDAQGNGDHAATGVVADAGGPRPLLENKTDVAILGQLRRRSDWVIPARLKKQIPENLGRLALEAEKDQTQIAASKELRALDALNIARDKALVQEEIRFIRQSPAQPPEPPEPPKKPLPEVIVDPETGDEYNAPIAAFFEEVTDDEAAETLQQLLDLGHEVHLLPEADRAEYLANKSNQEPEVPDGDRNK